MKEKKTEMLKRILIMLAGLLILAMGVALSVRSGLGVSPSASLSYVLSTVFPLTMGTVTILVNLIYILIQIVLLKKEYRLMNLLQIAVAVIFAFGNDLVLSLTERVMPHSYPLKLFLCIISCALMGFGLYLEVNANVLTMPSEGAISAISKKTGRDFGQIKILNDCLFTVLSVLISLIIFRKVEGIREGTLLSAVLVGLFSQLCYRSLPFFKKKEELQPYVVSDKYPLVITIERELGSGGHEIGEMIAKQLGIPFYDYKLIEKTAAETGLSNELITRKEEKLKGVWYTLYNQSYGYTRLESETDEIFDAQKKIIRDIASKESCVIVGRLGSFILKDRPNTFNVFISGDREYRAQRLSDIRKVEKEEMMKILTREDSLRKSYCFHFTGKPWGLARHYHLCLDVSAYGRDRAYELIKEAVEGFKKNGQTRS